MEQNIIIQKVSELLNITEEDANRLISDACSQSNTFDSLVDLLGYSNIEMIFEIFKLKKSFITDSTHDDSQSIYVEYEIPKAASIEEEKNLLETSILKENAQYFSYKQFNVVQSAVFNNIYNSDENVLISAPTGAGKTDIALLSILKALQYPNSQIIYIVPMKALANEIYNKYKKTLGNKYTVIEYTGDTEIDKKTATNARIIVCTPEKFDASTRKLECVFRSIKLIVIDEIHLLEDDRGPVLECIVARSLILSELRQSKIRIVGLSATLPNYKDVGLFIKAKHVHYFDSRYRPVPLKMTITGFTKHSTQNDEREYLLVKVQEYLNIKKQVIVFVNARAKTHKTANYLASNIPDLIQHCKQHDTDNNDLRNLINKSVGIHHAGMSRKDRLLVEKLFKEGKLSILVCTSTLAWGVNLPAYAVIIYGSKYYNSNKGTFDDMSILDVLQIFGRAGRPQFDKQGESILMTGADKMDAYINLLKRSSDIESKLLFSFPDAMNAEIYLNNVISMATALNWVKSTFLYVRMMKNPARYGINIDEIGQEEQALSEYIYLTIIFLEQCGLVKVIKKEDNYNTWKLESTVYGQIASIFYLNHSTMYTWLHGIHDVKDEKDLINMLLASKEFEHISVRSDEVGYLVKLHEELLIERVADFEFDETRESKLLVLLHCYLRFKKMQVFSLSCDQDYLIENLKRLVGAAKEMLLKLNRYTLYHTLFVIEKKIYRYKKSKFEQVIEMKGIRISDRFFELKIENIKETCTLFVYSKKVLVHVAHIVCSTRLVIPCRHEFVEVELHTIKDWRVCQQKLNIETNYSLNAFKRYGIHCCGKELSLDGTGTDCIHFQRITLFERLTDMNMEDHKTQKRLDYEKAAQVKLTITNSNLDAIENEEDETFGNLIDVSYNLNISFRVIESLNYRERMRKVAFAIESMQLENTLIVCPNREDVEETWRLLNTGAALANEGQVDKFGMGKKPMKNAKLWICDFEQAMGIYGFKTVIFKAISNHNGMFRMCDIYKIANNRETIIFENNDNVNFMKSIYKNHK